MNFAKGVLGLLVEPDACSSPRVVGFCKGVQQMAPPPKRAPALRLIEYIELERIVCESPNVIDRCIAGSLLFAVLACARASDMARVVSLEVKSSGTGRSGWTRLDRSQSSENQDDFWYQGSPAAPSPSWGSYVRATSRHGGVLHSWLHSRRPARTTTSFQPTPICLAKIRTQPQ